ncbi:MAG: Fic family protein [Firmicutes bacterium]|nr:Fic family protein [Bacillota bacterium]
MNLMEAKEMLDAKIGGNPYLQRKIDAVSRLQWIQSSYALDVARDPEREPLSPADIQVMLKGGSVGNRSLEDHIRIQNYAEMTRYVQGILPLKDKADRGLVEQINCILCTGSTGEPIYRKRSTVLNEFRIAPMAPDAIEEGMEKIIHRYNVAYRELNPVQRACLIHNEVLRVYPFDDANEATARAMMNFELMAAGMVPITFTMDPEQYRKGVGTYINRNDGRPFYNLILQEEIDRYGVLMDYLEKEE